VKAKLNVGEVIILLINLNLPTFI